MEYPEKLATHGTKTENKDKYNTISGLTTHSKNMAT
jgi:hypothetical protein